MSQVAATDSRGPKSCRVLASPSPSPSLLAKLGAPPSRGTQSSCSPHPTHEQGNHVCMELHKEFLQGIRPKGACKAMVDAGCAGGESLLLVLLHTATGQGAFSSCIPLRIITTRDCFSPLLRYFWCNFSFLICIHFDSAGVGAVFGADDKELCFFSSHCKWSLAGDFKNNAEIYFINSRFCLPPIIQLYENYQV